MKRTVRDLMCILQTLPPDMPVQFGIISGAWHGTCNPMRVSDAHFYNEDGDGALPLDKDAELHLFISEDKYEGPLPKSKLRKGGK